MKTKTLDIKITTGENEDGLHTVEVFCDGKRYGCTADDRTLWFAKGGAQDRVRQLLKEMWVDVGGCAAPEV